MKLEHEGTIRFLVVGILAGLFTFAIKHNFKFDLSETWKELVAEIIMACIIAFIWFLLRTIQHNEVNEKIIAAVLGTILFGGILNHIVLNIVSGSDIWEIDLSTILWDIIKTICLVAAGKKMYAPGESGISWIFDD